MTQTATAEPRRRAGSFLFRASLAEPVDAPQWSARDTPPSRGQVVAVLLGSGAIGFFLGMVRHPAWQNALEPAQVLAGLVGYPPQNPLYLYSTKTWTVLHQVPALLLYWGFSERALALGLSGVIGMLSLQALAVFVLALSRDVPLAILSSFFIYFTNAASGSVTYPLILMGSSHTYGMVGMSYLLLAIALIGAGQVGGGALLLGFAPAVHLTIGAWCAVIVALTIGMSPGWTRQVVKQAWPYFLAGAAASMLSAIIHLRTDYAALDPDLSAFVQHWDHHRQPFPLVSVRTLAACFSPGLAVLWLWRFRPDVSPHARLLLRILIVAVVLGGTLSVSYWFIPATVPNVIPALMPSRLLNLSFFTCMALIIGLSGSYRRSLWIQSNLAALVLVVLFLCLSPHANDRQRALFAWFGMGVSGLTLAILAELRRRGVGMSQAHPWQLNALQRTTELVVATVFVIVVITASKDFSRMKSLELPDWTSDPLLATAARRPGLLLTAGDLHLIQLQTRRPVLLDGGALDALLYVPQAEPETDRILRRVYGIDLLSLQHTHAGTLTVDTGKALWETRSGAEWQHIAREFGVTDVLTYPGWTLQLPVIFSSADYILYGIPAVIMRPTPGRG